MSDTIDNGEMIPASEHYTICRTCGHPRAEHAHREAETLRTRCLHAWGAVAKGIKGCSCQTFVAGVVAR